MVSPITFRHPASVAKVVATIDEMSAGRVELGLGAGWNEVEHRSASTPTRVSR
jgi:alkanesulfonate monooxygenase SsuD/methylene tetrahydromethanopterin reductase-like flavin-dependent oxidoreductase (luciferase family)